MSSASDEKDGNAPQSERIVRGHGTEILHGDTRQRYREKIARITLDSMELI